VCGACVGFLPRNLAVPARIFLGDGGSMPLGFAAAVLVMVAAGTSTVAWHSLLVGLLLVGIPALDTCLVIVSRRRRGVSILSGGRDHLTHRALLYLPNARVVALALGATQAALSLLAVLASRGEAWLVVISASLYLLIAGFAIVMLDSRRAEDFFAPDQRPGAARLALSKRAVACLLVLGLGLGISPFFFTYYSPSVWVPAGLGVTLLSAIAFVLRPTRPSAPAALALFGLLGLGVWSLWSTTWAESVENAVVSGNRWLVYGALLLLMFVLVSHDRRAAVLLGAAGVGICAVALSVLVRMLGGDPGSLFLGGRLNAPLGYINGEGCLFAMGIWPCVAVGEHRRALFAGAGAGLATLMACLALLSQSRGTALAVAGSLLVVLLLVPGRARRAYLLLAVGAGAAIAADSLLHVYDRANGGAVSVSSAHAAGIAALLASLGVGIGWGVAVACWRMGDDRAAERRRVIATWLLVVPIAAALVIGLARAARIEHTLSSQWHAFVHVSEVGEGGGPYAPATSRTRLLSGAGNRYDYWRIAWRLWKQKPLLGVGAGNYPRPYFERRATIEDVQQPHSLVLQVLCELGLVGLLLLACFLGGVGWSVVRMRPTAGRSALRRGLMTAAIGVFCAWLIQSSVDWMHLLPGLTGIALVAATTLMWPRRRQTGTQAVSGAAPRSRRTLVRRPALALGVSALSITLIAAGASLSRQGLSQLYRERAQNELARSPTAALSDVGRSLQIDSDAAQSYYVQAAAFARFDQPHAAEAALVAALTREPRNFVTWTLLGDISLRQRLIAAAKRDYTRAHELNPRNPFVRALALNPGAALR
jgi:hypothetical protein